MLIIPVLYFCIDDVLPSCVCPSPSILCECYFLSFPNNNNNNKHIICSTDGSVSPKPRWSKGTPPTSEVATTTDKAAQECTTPATAGSISDEEAPSSPPSLRPGSGLGSGGTGNNSGSGIKSYVMAWRWLVEDEAASEPKLQKPTDDSPVVLPQLSDAGRELLCRHVELRLLEVSLISITTVGADHSLTEGFCPVPPMPFAASGSLDLTPLVRVVVEPVSH